MNTTLTGGRASQILRGLASTITLVVLLAGLPTALYAVLGSPIPHSLPTRQDIWARLMQPDTDDTVLMLVLKVIGWACWAIFTTSFLAEATALLRGATLRLPGPARPAQALARDLLTSAALIFTTGSSLTSAGAGTAGAAGHHHQIAAPADPGPAHAAHPAHPAAAETRQTGLTVVPAALPLPSHPAAHHAMPPTERASQARERPWRAYTIHRGDTLWEIARHAYGTGTGYPQIFHASTGLHQPDGLPSITDPDQIYPGQHVTIPPPHTHHEQPPRPHPSPPRRSPGHQPPARTPGTSAPTPSPGSSPSSPRPPGATNPQPVPPTATPPRDPSPTASPAPGRTPHQTPSQGPGGASPPAARTPPTSPRNTPAPATPRPTPTGPTTSPTRPPAPPPGTPRTSSPTPSADAPPPPSAAPSTPPSARSPSQPPATRPASPTPSKSPESPGAPAPPHSDHKHTDQGPVTVALRTGGYVGLGLAAAISIALALTRAHRRHQRPHVEEWPPAYEPEPEPPEPVAQIRRAHLQALAHTGDAMPTDEDLVADDFATPEPTRITLGTRTTPHPSPDHDHPDQEHPDPERREPGREVEVAFELAGLSIGLTGPGAVDAVRTVFVELLARSRHGRVELVLTHTDAATLLDGTGIAPAHLADAVDGLTLLPDASEVAAHLETQVLHRRRMMTYHDVRDVPALRTADPAESLPAIIVIATLLARDEALEAIVTFGARYCVGGLILGPWPPGPTLDIDTDGTITHTTSPDPTARPYRDAGPWADAAAWMGVRLFHLAPAEATGLLQTIHTATGKLHTPPRESPSRNREAHPPQSPTPTPTPPDTSTGHGQPAQRDRPDRSDPATAAGGGLPVPATGRVVAAPGHPPADRSPGTEPDQDRPVLVRVLGPVRVQARGQPITTGIRTNGYTLLAYLALNPQGITRDQGITALWPEDPPGTAPRLFHTAVNNIRGALRAATGLHEPMFITLAQNRYRLDPALIDVDLWRLQGVLETAQQADDDTTRLHALRQIPDLYTGELAADVHAEWAETHREQLRRHATDALVYLARLTQNTDPDQALAALEQAITHDPYTEPVYRSVMRIQARQHRPDAVLRTYQLCETRLAELDIDPAPETQQLVAELTRPRRARPPALLLRDDAPSVGSADQ